MGLLGCFQVDRTELNFYAIVLQGVTTRRKLGEGCMGVSQFSQLESEELVGFVSSDIGHLWGQFPVFFIDSLFCSWILVCSSEEVSPRSFYSTLLSQLPEK